MKKIFLVLLIIFLSLSFVLCQINNFSSLQNKNLIANSVSENSFKIKFTYTSDISEKPISGRIILGFNSDTSKPIDNPNIFNPQPTFAWDISNWKAGEEILLDGKDAISWKGYLDSLDGWYGVQAALKTNKDGRTIKATGNAVTSKKIIYIEKGKTNEPLELIFSIKWKGTKKFKETDLLKEVNIKSSLMTEFYGRPDSIQTAVILPESYFKDSSKFYPSVYIFGGWNSSHFDAMYDEPQKRYGMTGFGEEKVYIFVNHECKSGYHVFCSSDLNGPREDTFFKEIIPYIENKFRVIKNPQTRFLMGQSSGAWAGLWLLINYPDEFGGVYAGSPDPVDFTDFVGTNIYEKNANMYFDSKGKTKYIINGQENYYPSLAMKDFTANDLIIGWGEQMYSFDAAFSKKNINGEPLHLYDWNTGKVNAEVATYWETHDLSKVISKYDKAKISLLKDKIHIYVADNDPFGLNRPVKLFQKTLTDKGIKADIRFFTEGGHIIWTDDLRKIIHEDIDKKIHSKNVAN